MRSIAKRPPPNRLPTAAKSPEADATRDHRPNLEGAVLTLQQTTGNQAVQRLLAAGDASLAGSGNIALPTRQGRARPASLADHPSSARGLPTLQRFAFVNEVQILAKDKSFTPEMEAMFADDKVRNYTGVDEFKKHADKTTDYLGNLGDGTWVRFSPSGINLLGENHTATSLEKVVPFINTTNFIYEPFASDVLPAGSNFRSAYETENKDRFKTFGVDKAPDKQPFGAESLFPKMGFALTIAIPYFEGGKPMTDLDSSGYVGQPVQRYLKIAWGYSKDNKADVAAKKKAKQQVGPRMDALATVHAAVEGKLDAFITGLVVDGHIGDELVKPANAGLLPPLAEFVKAFTDAMVEMAATESSSRLTAAERKKLGGKKSQSEADKTALFSKWRDFMFEDNVKAATKRGVRYAGMGQLHLDHLVAVGLDKDQHPFEMDGKDIAVFVALTDKLKKAAKKPTP